MRLGFGPREKGMMVEHPPRVLATLTDVAVKLLFADGKLMSAVLPPASPRGSTVRNAADRKRERAAARSSFD